MLTVVVVLTSPPSSLVVVVVREEPGAGAYALNRETGEWPPPCGLIAFYTTNNQPMLRAISKLGVRSYPKLIGKLICRLDQDSLLDISSPFRHVARLLRIAPFR